MNINLIRGKTKTEVRKMTNYKFITSNDENNSSNTSNTQNPGKNRKRHKPVKGLPRV